MEETPKEKLYIEIDGKLYKWKEGKAPQGSKRIMKKEEKKYE